MLRVLHGPFEALEPAFLDALRDLKGRRVAVVAPSRRLADRLQRVAAVEGGLALLDVHFHTFFSLAQAVVADDPPTQRLIADPVFHDRLVDQLLTGARARARGLAPAVRSSLRDLIDAGVTRAALDLGDARLEPVGTLLGLAEAYERRLEELGVLSPSGLTRLAAARAAASPALARFDEILYYGFYDLTGLQLEFFESVVSSFPSRLFFPYRRGHAAFRFADAFFEQKLLAHAVSTVETAPRPHLDALFEPAKPAAPWPGLQLISASGARDEAWAAAKEALRLVEQEGFAFEDIAVVARAVEPYRHALAEAFSESGLPLELSGGEPLLRRPLAKTALNLLTLKVRDFPALTVDDIFSSPYYNRLQRGPNPVHAWRSAVRFLGIRAGWLQWRGKLERRVEEDLQLSEDYSVPKEELASLWKLVSGLEKALSDETERTWAGKAARAKALLAAHLRLPEEPEPDELAAWDAVQAALDSLAGFDLLGAPCSWPELLEALEDKLRAASLDNASGRRGVRAMGAMDARGESFRALILIGLKEGSFPRQVREDPLLRDDARARLRHPAGYWVQQKGAGHEEERLLFWLCAASARERLVCVYPRSDENGRAQVPSLYLRELCRAAGARLEEARPVPRQPAAKLERLDPLLASPKEVSLRRALEGGGDWEHLAAFNAWAPAGGALDGVVGAPDEYLRSLRRSGLSPSALDKLAECPFAFFASRVLGLSEGDEAYGQGQFAAKVRGKIYHAALERFYRRLADTGWADEEKALTAAVDSVFRDYDWQGMGLYPVLWRAERDVISGHLAAFTQWDLAEIRKSGLKPKWLEKRLEGPLPGLDWRAQGVADRIDVDEDGKRFRVIDYKLRPRSGMAHQLPLYGLLAAKLLGDGWTLAGSHLYYLEDDERVGEGELGAESFEPALARAAKQINAGRFPIRPDDNEYNGYCTRCAYSLLCRRSHGPSKRRAAVLTSEEA